MTKMRSKKLKRGIYLLPNLFTVSVLFAGFYAIIASLNSKYDNAAVSIFIAMLMDSLDGRVARLTNTVTAFGAELDSLCDMVSFGLAPAVSIYVFALSNLGKFGWLAAFIYVVAVALRLARFNTQIGKVNKIYFQGLSCTASAGVLAGFLSTSIDYGISPNFLEHILSIVLIVLGFLMVSNFRYRSFKDIDLRDHVSFVVILMMVLVLVLISLEPSILLLTIFSVYAISGPVSTILGLRKHKKARMVLNLKKFGKNAK